MPDESGRGPGDLPSSAKTKSASWPLGDSEIAAWTDVYFQKTRKAVERFGDLQVTYAVFMRRPVISAPRWRMA